MICNCKLQNLNRTFFRIDHSIYLMNLLLGVVYFPCWEQLQAEIWVSACPVPSWGEDETVWMRKQRLGAGCLYLSCDAEASETMDESDKTCFISIWLQCFLVHFISIFGILPQSFAKAIPFRASKLTFLLRESLAGNSRTLRPQLQV